jgi:hypothetical protein
MEVRKVKKYCLVIVCFIIVSFFAGCDIGEKINHKNKILPVNSSEVSNKKVNPSIQTDNGEEIKSTNNNVEKDTMISELNNLKVNEEDFNIKYMDTIINDKVSFKQIADKLGIIIGEDSDNIEVKAGSSDYMWYVLHYPSKEKEDIRIEFLVNEALKTETLLYINLFNVETSRGIAVGDDLDKLLLTYGDNVEPQYNSSSTDYFEYRLEQNNSDKVIKIIVNRDEKKIEKISINYCLNKAMEELDIPAFD